jgi:hypothetical protein
MARMGICSMQDAMHSYHHDICYALQRKGNEELGARGEGEVGAFIVSSCRWVCFAGLVSRFVKGGIWKFEFRRRKIIGWSQVFPHKMGDMDDERSRHRRLDVS